MLRAFISVLTCILLASPVMAQSPTKMWGKVLTSHISTPDDGVARFDYAGLKSDPAAQDALTAYLHHFETTDLSEVTPENFANWINIYNAATIQHIVSRYPTKSIRDGYLFGGPWKKVHITINNQPVSLHEIEHEILRETYKDPRLHYALNCASYGCPDLKSTLWTAETLTSDLDAAARAYINHPRGVTVTSSGLTLSRIFKWYRDDFGGSDASILTHLQSHADEPLASALENRPSIRNYEYDWSLNDLK